MRSGMCRMVTNCRGASSWGIQVRSEQQEVHRRCTDSALLAELKFCSITRNLEQGKKVHARVLETGGSLSTRLATALVNMYAKCGSMTDARRVFDSIKHPDVVSWTTILLGYADSGDGQIALDLFSKMKAQGCRPDARAHVAALKACGSIALNQDSRGKAACLKLGKQLHSEIGSELDIYIQSTLVDMYAKCGSMMDACRVFDSIKNPSVVSWTALIMGYADNGEGQLALDKFRQMKSQGCSPNWITYVAALRACVSLVLNWGGAQCLEEGKRIHAEIGCHASPHIQSGLIDMYAKCGSMVDAHQVFDTIRKPDVVSWNALILGYADSGEELAALDLFSRMKSEGCVPDSITFVAALKACTSLATKQSCSGREKWLERGRQIHSEIGCHLDLHVQNSLVHMYAKCGSMLDAQRIFDSIRQPDVVLWTALILGYADSGEGHIAFDAFSRMNSEGCIPDSLTFVGALKACSLLGALELGRKVHAEISDVDSILVTCLIDFYAKCGSLVEAQEVFDLHSNSRDVNTWNTLLAGYCSFGETDSAFGLFERMQDAGFQPDEVTFQCILMCCSHAGLVEKARHYFEAMSAKYGVIPSIQHYTCMVDVLGRANKLDDALMWLQRMPSKPDAVTWLTVLGSCRKWKSVEIGRLAFQSLVSLDERNAAAYILMAQIYASRGMWEEEKLVLGMTKVSQVWNVQGQTCWTNEAGGVHELLAGCTDHPQIREIQEKVKCMQEAMKEHGYVADAKEDEEEQVHSAKLAVACALINTKSGETIWLVKNLVLCSNCHELMAFVSRLERRTIFLRDTSRFHVFKNGECSCRQECHFVQMPG